MSKYSRTSDWQVEKLKMIKEPIAPRCSKAIEDGVTHICSRVHGESCSAYAFPKTKWRLGDCPLADNLLRTPINIKTLDLKKRIGQQKQKKKTRK